MSPTAEVLEIFRMDGETEERAYVHLVGKFTLLPSRKSLKKALKAQRIIDLETSHALSELSSLRKGMSIALLAADSLPPVWEFPLKVVYEDDDLAVVYKPSGMTTASAKRRCLKNALAFNLKISQSDGRLAAPLPVHRLDHATEGLVVCAKTAPALATLGRQFEARKVKKTYEAIVLGHYSGLYTIDSPIDGKEAITHIASIVPYTTRSGEQRSKLILEPMHGRTHQLRIHLSSLGYAIVGDRLYGSTARGKLRLRAVAIAFEHPRLESSLSIAFQ
jgi:tRNA pseudouridine65 synthase/23S rRNA pseudouridine1911/1915/1917 synthase